MTLWQGTAKNVTEFVYCWPATMRHTSRVISPQWDYLGENYIFFCKGLSIGGSFWVRGGNRCSLLLALGQHLKQIHAGPVQRALHQLNSYYPHTQRIHTMFLVLGLGFLTQDNFVFWFYPFVCKLHDFFKQLSNTPLCKQTTFSLLILLLRVTYVVSSSWLLRMKLQWTWLSKCPCSRIVLWVYVQRCSSWVLR